VHELNQALLVLHFLGLAMGLAVPLANMVLMTIVSRATPDERAVLARFPPRMVRVGDTGLVLLWATGLTLVFTKWGGFAVLPWQFHVKLTAVVLLTLTIGYVHALMGKAKRGDAAAAARMPAVGRVALLFALTAVVFAVLTFN
jgi:uncharacterized membrane protein